MSTETPGAHYAAAYTFPDGTVAAVIATRGTQAICSITGKPTDMTTFGEYALTITSADRTSEVTLTIRSEGHSNILSNLTSGAEAIASIRDVTQDVVPAVAS